MLLFVFYTLSVHAILLKLVIDRRFDFNFGRKSNFRRKNGRHKPKQPVFLSVSSYLNFFFYLFPVNEYFNVFEFSDCHLSCSHILYGFVCSLLILVHKSTILHHSLKLWKINEILSTNDLTLRIKLCLYVG